MNESHPPAETPYPDEYKQAAAWLYRKRNGANWWHPTVLTADNPDVESLCLERSLAYSIFDCFKERGYIRKTGELPWIPDNGNRDIYFIVRKNIKELKKFSNLPWYIKHTPEWLFDWLGKFKNWITISIILIATSFFQSFFSKWGEWFYELITKK